MMDGNTFLRIPRDGMIMFRDHALIKLDADRLLKLIAASIADGKREINLGDLEGEE